VTRLSHLDVIAGLDPAIHGRDRRSVALDRRVRPGDDNRVGRSNRISG